MKQRDSGLLDIEENKGLRVLCRKSDTKSF